MLESAEVNQYNKIYRLSSSDEKWLLETIEELEREGINLNGNNGDSGIVNGSVNSGGKLRENFYETQRKLQAISNLKNCSYLTPSVEIASHLQILFGVWQEKPDHWLYIAQHYTPKTINAVIACMVKAHKRGDITFYKSGAYFTHIIKHKHKRKEFRHAIGV